mgnify:CR=1 FL=1
MKKKHLIVLREMIEHSFSAHKMANWNDLSARKTVAGLLMKKFAKYMRDQEDLEKLGMTEEDAMIPPGGLGHGIVPKKDD